MSVGEPSREALIDDLWHEQRHGDLTVMDALRKAYEAGWQARAELRDSDTPRPIDGKFGISADRRIVNLVSGEAIPEDEPLFLLRGRDHHALEAIQAYRSICAKDCNALHMDGINQAANRFALFQVEHPERMKQPGITKHFKLDSDTPLSQPGSIPSHDAAEIGTGAKNTADGTAGNLTSMPPCKHFWSEGNKAFGCVLPAGHDGDHSAFAKRAGEPLSQPAIEEAARQNWNIVAEITSLLKRHQEMGGCAEENCGCPGSQLSAILRSELGEAEDKLNG